MSRESRVKSQESGVRSRRLEPEGSVFARSLYEVTPRKLTTKQSPAYEVPPVIARAEINAPEPSTHFVGRGLLRHVRDGVSNDFSQ